MGNGSVYRTLPESARPDYIFAITLIDERNEEQKQEDLKKNIYIIEGNVALPSTWKKLDNLRQKLGISSIQHCYARPLNGMETIPDNPWFLLYLANKIYKLLDCDGGIFISECPRGTGNEILNWVRNANNQGLDTEAMIIFYDRSYLQIRPAIKIVKHLDSPEELPQLYES